MTSERRNTVVAAVVVLLTVAAGMLFLRPARHAAPASNSTVVSASSPRDPDANSVTLPVERVPSEVHESRLSRVFVSDEAGLPAITAWVTPGRLEGRAFVSPGQSIACDAEGRADLLLKKEDAALQVGAPNYAPVVIAAPVAGATYRVSLERGVRLVVECVGLNGQPREGIKVTAYERAGAGLVDASADNSADSPMIVTDVHDMVHVATSDVNGRADFARLSAGKYVCEVDDGRFAVVQRRDGYGLVLELGPEQPELTVHAVVEPILAAVIRVVGDEIVSHVWSDKKRALYFGGDEVQLAMLELERVHRGCLCIAAVAAREIVGGSGSELLLRIETASRGALEQDVRLAPIEDVVVSDLDLGGRSVTVRHPNVRLVLRDVRSRELEGMRLELADVDDRTRRFSLFSGRRQPLPAGNYRVACVLHEVLGRALREQGVLKITPERRDFEWTLGIPVDVTKLLVRGIDGGFPKYCSVGMTLNGKPVGATGYCSPEEIQLVYSDPTTVVSLQAFGYRAVELVGLASRGSVVEVQLERAR